MIWSLSNEWLNPCRPVDVRSGNCSVFELLILSACKLITGSASDIPYCLCQVGSCFIIDLLAGFFDLGRNTFKGTVDRRIT